jgi:hypothetical protein
MGVWYATREAVMSALDVRGSARPTADVDAAIESSSRGIDGDRPGGGFLRRRFYPEMRTQAFDWPSSQFGGWWRLWLDADELVSVTSVTDGAVTLDPSKYRLRPDHGPPYSYLEIDLATGTAWTSATRISITGVYGHGADEVPAGALSAGINASVTSVTVTNAAAVDVGHILRADTERMIVTDRAMVDSTQNIGGNLDAMTSTVAVPVTTGSAYAPGEVILVDSERMLIEDVSGNTLVVRRAWSGSTLAAHTTGADIFVSRGLTVTRGALGTTAAIHSAVALARHVVPGPVVDLAVAETLNTLLQRRTGYARTVGGGDVERDAPGGSLADVRERARAAYGRKLRGRAV